MAKYLELSAKVTVKSDGKMGENSMFDSPVRSKQENADEKRMSIKMKNPKETTFNKRGI